jgi:23S rRNA (adenine2503-C2)-methyltransferase
MNVWPNIKRFDSSDSRVFKYVFTSDDAVAEAVLYRYPEFEDRTVICCSTQSGCPVGCKFCGTGKRFIRNLTALEIVDQIKHALKDHEIDTDSVRKLQFMFMSMGEPLLNMDNVAPAVRFLHEFHPTADLLISTMGPKANKQAWQELFDLSIDIHKVGLQFSVHESSDEARDSLIPFKSKLSLSDIAYHGAVFATLTGRKPFFNYCAHSNNTSDQDADRLLALFPPNVWECTISVVCEANESVKAATERQQALASEFSSKMLDRGYSTRVFNPAGQDDIGGGCGQLWFVQNWIKNRRLNVL